MSDVQARGPKRQAHDKADDGVHKAWRVDDIDALGGRLTFEELSATIREEFPDLATQWCSEFLELKQKAAALAGMVQWWVGATFLSWQGLVKLRGATGRTTPGWRPDDTLPLTQEDPTEATLLGVSGPLHHRRQVETPDQLQDLVDRLTPGQLEGLVDVDSEGSARRKAVEMLSVVT